MEEDAPKHRVFQNNQHSGIISPWEIVHDHPLVAPWKAIPRCCVLLGETGYDTYGSPPWPRFSMAIKTADTFVHAGDIARPKLRVILKAAVPSKFGRNEETVFDEQVRRGLEVGPDVIKFRFVSTEQPTVDETDEVVKMISDHFAEKLRPLFPQAQTITLKFCKLALYKEGGHFSQHKDTAHGPSHQGTLLMEVKTDHTGGKLSFQVDDEVIDWNLAESYSYFVRWCAFHTDISHQVHEVTSGVRAVLQFDIHVTHREDIVADDEDVYEIESGDDHGDDGDDSQLEENDQNTVDNKEGVEDDEEENYDDEYAEEEEDEEEEEERKDDDGHLFGRTHPLLNRNRASILEQTACQQFIAELSKHTAKNAIAMPLFHAYHHAYLRPEFLKSMDRALFDALIAAGYRVLLMPVLISSTGDYENRYFEYAIGPCDPYDKIYCSGKVKDEDGRAKIFSTPAGSVKAANVKYIFTESLQSKEFYRQEFIQHTGNECQSAEMKYYSAAMVILQRPSVPDKNISPYSALLLDQASADVTLIVQGERVPAHKEVLCACSAVFRAMFLSPMKEAASNEVTVREEHSLETVKAMLHFIYTDAIPAPLLKAELLQLLPLAIYYQMDELKQYAEEACRAFVDVHNVQHIVQAVRQHAECAALLQDILRWIADHAKLLATTNPTFVSHLDADSTELVVKALIGLVD